MANKPFYTIKKLKTSQTLQMATWPSECWNINPKRTALIVQSF